MPRNSAARWLLTLALLVAAVAGGRLVRPHVSAWTQGRLVQLQQAELAAAPEAAAAQIIRRLAQDEQWLAVIVAALADTRPPVAAAARTSVLNHIESWNQLPTAESSR